MATLLLPGRHPFESSLQSGKAEEYGMHDPTQGLLNVKYIYANAVGQSIHKPSCEIEHSKVDRRAGTPLLISGSREGTALKIAAAQTPVSSDVRANGATIRQVIAEAAAEGVTLMSFCEGALSGYAKAQIADPEDWRSFDWEAQTAELQSIARVCGELGVVAVVGGAHPLSTAHRPHNSLYVLSTDGGLLTRYDKRYLSNSELGDWYTPGSDAIVFEVDGYRFGCAICIESQFPEVFSEYERLAVDAVLFSSYGVPEHFSIALRAHAGLNCLWIGVATPAQKAARGPAGIIGPDGQWVMRCPAAPLGHYVVATLDRDDPTYGVPLRRARPWRAKARQGDIYREKMVDDPRSRNRSDY